ncbi:hypothetical protein pb186bvf_017351 [Paramecium bursaria]
MLIFIIQCVARLIIQEQELQDRQLQSDYAQYCKKGDEDQIFGLIEAINGFASFTYYNTNQLQTIIYIGGGPGQSSQFANYLEIGPKIFVQDKVDLQDNPHSWSKFANLLFLDLPVGTGYGFTDKESISIDDNTEDFYEILIQLKKEQDCKIDLKDYYIFTTDFGAKYALDIASNHVRKTNLLGLGLLNPFINPLSTLKELCNFGYHMGIIDYQERQMLERQAVSSLSDFHVQGKDAYQEIIQYMETESGVSMYNIMEPIDYYKKLELKVINYLNQTNNKYGIEFLGYSKQVYDLLQSEYMISVSPYLEQLLKDTQIRILIYQSQFDMTVNVPGTMRWVYQINYFLQQNFQKNYNILVIQGKNEGIVKKAGKLEYRMVQKSGQLMHQDKPNITFGIIQEWLKL